MRQAVPIVAKKPTGKLSAKQSAVPAGCGAGPKLESYAKKNIVTSQQD